MALSSEEAGLHAATRALSEATGFNTLGQSFGEDVRIRTFAGAQAAKGLSHRAGLAKARDEDTAE